MPDAKASGEIKIINLTPSADQDRATDNSQNSNGSNTLSIRVRSGYHRNYDRLVFDGAANENYAIEEEEGRTILRFPRQGSLDRRSLSLENTPLIENVSVLTIDPLVITIDESASLWEEKKLGNKLIIDFQRARAETPEQARQARSAEEPRIIIQRVDEAALAQAPARPSKPDAPANVSRPDEKPTPQQEAGVESPSDKSAIPELVEYDAQASRPPKTPSAQSTTNTAPAATVEAVSEQPLARLGTSDFESKRENLDNQPTLSSRSANRLNRLRALRSRLNNDARTPDRLRPGTTVSVSSLKPLELAVFKRGAYLWVVQSEKRQGVPPLVEGQRNVNPVLVTDRKDRAEAWVLPIEPSAGVQVQSNDFEWDIMVVDQEAEIVGQGLKPALDLVVHEGVEKYAVLLELDEISNPLEFSDPNLGDRFIAIPVTDPELRVTRDRSYPQFKFIPSKSGVVFKAFTPDLDYFYQGDMFFITSMNELLVSPIEMATATQPLEFEDNELEKNKPFFNINDWFISRAEDFNRNRRAFEQNVTDASDQASRVNSLINLAKLYFAHGFGHEAMGILRIAKAVDRKLVDNPNFIALEGAAMSLADRHSQAFARLYDARIKDEPEMALWRGYSHARKRNWKAAYDEFAKSGDIILSYPRVLQAKMVPSLTEATLFVGDIANTGSLIQVLESSKDLHRKEESILNYFKGQMNNLNGDTESAMRFLRLAANGADRYYRAKAAFELLKIQREEEVLDDDKAVEILERLRYVWRGDNFEINVMEYLSDLYYSSGKYTKALHMLRNILPLVVDDQERTEIVTQKLSNLFRKLFIDDESENLQPLSALALYNEFSELTPVGPEGDVAIQKLAERMVKVDLLDRAARLLEHQIKFRLEDIDKARVGARLASIRLLDKAPTLAFEALDNTIVQDMPQALSEERQLLRARAYSQLNQPDRAIKILSGLNSEMAHRLNIDVNWKAGRWAQAATAIQPLLDYLLEEKGLLDSRGRLDSLDPETANLVLNQAVAHTLAGDQGAVRELYQDYAATMAEQPQNDLFLLITRAPRTGELADLATLQDHIGEVDLFRSFLNAYRADVTKEDSGS